MLFKLKDRENLQCHQIQFLQNQQVPIQLFPSLTPEKVSVANFTLYFKASKRHLPREKRLSFTLTGSLQAFVVLLNLNQKSKMEKFQY